MREATERLAIATMLEIVMFEHWLRFYFIEESAPEELRLVLPQKSRARILELYPALYPLADKLAGRPIDFETSRTAVLEQIAETMTGRGFTDSDIAVILASAAFQIKLELFHAWEQLHENQLEQGFAEFRAWQALFEKWSDTPGARELLRQGLAKDYGD